ncbi:hypothetical protein Nepgr_019292 [Nepenthes gracilis]|uniref:Nucleotide-diphospho-sugar transferase domain-containing protein n=1 Tax=Nepenthes gracilis TaxID=150966 RepID=A0AAD3SWQ6_NEPGR|nr:hypothetical protein Nepgr_019292 [Nepenthes gracilis]
MENKTIILTTLNEAWAAPNSTFDLFLESFKIGNNTPWLLKHLVVVALDENAYGRCVMVHPHCYLLHTGGTNFSKEAYFLSPTYLQMMWRRIDLLHTVLRLGYNFIFTDVDIMWLRNPFPHFYAEADFQIACDHFNGNSSDINNFPNGGFNYIISNNRTVHFYEFWYQSRLKYPGEHDQDVLNKIKHDPTVRNIGLKMRFLDTIYFGGFCEPSRDMNEVCTMHANCCIGLEKKVHDLSLVLQDWKMYMSLPPDQRSPNSSRWRAPQKCHL